MVDPLAPYNFILGNPALNLLGTILSSTHLSLKYMLSDGRVGLIQGY